MNAFKKYILLTTLQICSLQWWDVGHMLTAAIAERRLNSLHPYASAHFKQLVTSINSLVDNKSRTFIESSCWADDIKSAKYSMNIWNSWHYTDKTFVSDGVFPVINFTEAAVNSIQLVNHAIKTIKTNINKNTAERALFSRYLVHVVGDMHQPLHSVALFNQTFPSGDRGGNSIKVTLPNETAVNLHSFWDAGGFLVQNDSFVFPRPLNQQNYTLLKSIADQYIKNYGPEVQKLGQDINPVHWAFQSYLIAQNTTYPELFKTNRVGQKYINNAYETSKRQITLGGYRLCNLIIHLYEDSPKIKQQIKAWQNQQDRQKVFRIKSIVQQ